MVSHDLPCCNVIPLILFILELNENVDQPSIILRSFADRFQKLRHAFWHLLASLMKHFSSRICNPIFHESTKILSVLLVLSLL
uniref:Uncharacterized protein n=1 Tax=Setaria viridis TaxID=4556 RepID=A0A4V6D7Z2_SETVI|nr:hypothetical protein SEVIR_4G076301v2 [Setaria viridis]